MKPVNYITTNLFDSTLARFKLTVECRMTRVRQTDQTLEKLAYIDAKGNATIKPNIYLVFTYRGDSYEENKSLYTSYPQLFRIRGALEEIKNILLDEAAWDDSQGVLEVRPEYKNPVVLADIGKDKKWISFTPAVITGSDELATKSKGVLIEISGPSREASALSMDEFLTIYTIINDLDLTSIQIQLSTMFLLGDEQTTFAPQYNAGYAPRPQYGYSQPVAPQAYAPRAPQAPRYNNQPRTQAPRTTYNTQNAPAPSQPTYQPYVQTAPRAQTNNLPPRQSAAPIVNLQAVEETPVDETNWNDQTVDQIFGDE